MKERTNSYLIIAALCVGLVFVWWLVPFPFPGEPKLTRHESVFYHASNHLKYYYTRFSVVNENKRDWEGVVWLKVVDVWYDEDERYEVTLWERTYRKIVQAYEAEVVEDYIPVEVIKGACLEGLDFVTVECRWGNLTMQSGTLIFSSSGFGIVK